MSSSPRSRAGLKPAEHQRPVPTSPDPTWSSLRGRLLAGDSDELWELLVELGSGPSGFPNEARLDQYRIRGCTSRVWLLIEPASSEETATARWWFDSDSVVIRGVLRVVAAAYADLSVAQLRDGELERRLAEGGIGRYLLPSRARGLHEVLRRLRGVVEDRA